MVAASEVVFPFIIQREQPNHQACLFVDEKQEKKVRPLLQALAGCCRFGANVLYLTQSQLYVLQKMGLGLDLEPISAV